MTFCLNSTHFVSGSWRPWRLHILWRIRSQDHCLPKTGECQQQEGWRGQIYFIPQILLQTQTVVLIIIIPGGKTGLFGWCHGRLLKASTIPSLQPSIAVHFLYYSMCSKCSNQRISSPDQCICRDACTLPLQLPAPFTSKVFSILHSILFPIFWAPTNCGPP